MDMFMQGVLSAVVIGDKRKHLSLLMFAKVVYIHRFFHIWKSRICHSFCTFSL